MLNEKIILFLNEIFSKRSFLMFFMKENSFLCGFSCLLSGNFLFTSKRIFSLFFCNGKQLENHIVLIVGSKTKQKVIFMHTRICGRFAKEIAEAACEKKEIIAFILSLEGFPLFFFTQHLNSEWQQLWLLRVSN